MEDLQDILEGEWQNVRGSFYYPQLPMPRLAENIPNGTFDFKNLQISINPDYIEKLKHDGCDENMSLNAILGHETGHFVDYPGSILNLLRLHKVARESLDEVKQMNITDIEAEVSNLSGGQRQAVAINRAMHWGSEVLLLDEPAAALGVREAHEVLNLIMDLKRKGHTILIVAHNLTHVFRVADTITVLRGGRKIGTVHKKSTNVDEVVKMITGAEML